MKRVAVILLLSLLLMLTGCNNDGSVNENEIDLGFWGNLFGVGDAIGGAISSAVGGIMDGMAFLFVPDENFFASFNADIRRAIDNKTSGLSSSWDSVTSGFNQLRNNQTINNTLTFTLPDNFVYQGYKGKSLNALSGVDGFISMFRGVITAFIVITTLFYCYRKVAALFKG